MNFLKRFLLNLTIFLGITVALGAALLGIAFVYNYMTVHFSGTVVEIGILMIALLVSGACTAFFITLLLDDDCDGS